MFIATNQLDIPDFACGPLQLHEESPKAPHLLLGAGVYVALEAEVNGYRWRITHIFTPIETQRTCTLMAITMMNLMRAILTLINPTLHDLADMEEILEMMTSSEEEVSSLLVFQILLMNILENLRMNSTMDTLEKRHIIRRNLHPKNQAPLVVTRFQSIHYLLLQNLVLEFLQFL